jgi:hypothetical protein
LYSVKSSSMKQVFILSKDSPAVKTVFNNSSDYARELFRSGSVRITIEPHKKNRSLQQNAYFYKLVRILSDYTGYDVEDVKEYILEECKLTREAQTWRGTQTKVRSTTSLNVQEFSLIIETAITLCERNNLHYPKPDHFGYEIS